jgi:phosphopantothenoylcysteine synthetase/decarboxylase
MKYLITEYGNTGKELTDMHKAVVELAPNHDSIILCARLSDYKPLEVAHSKISR